MIAENAVFKGRKITIDGGSFYSCKFDGCTLVYSGLMPATLEDCNFNACSWEFSGPALNTISFMTALYAGGGKILIENTLQKIRGETAGPGPTLQ